MKVKKKGDFETSKAKENLNYESEGDWWLLALLKMKKIVKLPKCESKCFSTSKYWWQNVKVNMAGDFNILNFERVWWLLSFQIVKMKVVGDF